jgi:hypothetical protein
VVCHAVLDAAGHIHVLGFGVDNALATIEIEMNREQGSVADHSFQTTQPAVIRICRRFCSYH